MKDLKDIFEGILDKGNKTCVGTNIDTLTLFGNTYKLVGQHNLNSNNLKWLNGRALNKMTKGMDYLRDFGYFHHNDKSMKVGSLCNWIEHISLSSWGITDLNNTNDQNTFRERLKTELDKLGVFNKDLNLRNKVDPYISVVFRNDGSIIMLISRVSWNSDNRIEIEFDKL